MGPSERNAVTTREYQVSGMSCGHCEAAVKDEVGQIPGVDSVDVNVGTGRLVVRSSIPVDAGAVLRAVDEAGYQAVMVA
jgi:copper chaperone